MHFEHIIIDGNDYFATASDDGVAIDFYFVPASYDDEQDEIKSLTVEGGLFYAEYDIERNASHDELKGIYLMFDGLPLSLFNVLGAAQACLEDSAEAERLEEREPYDVPVVL